MFTVYCPDHGCPVLLDASCIEAPHNTPDGPVLAWHCWCGTRGRLRPVTRPPSQPDAA